ncbi:hypothetical protein X975_13024, partial [Stegodyphus mimosarum]
MRFRSVGEILKAFSNSVFNHKSREVLSRKYQQQKF